MGFCFLPSHPIVVASYRGRHRAKRGIIHSVLGSPQWGSPTLLIAGSQTAGRFANRPYTCSALQSDAVGSLL